MLELHDVSFSYTDQPTIKNISFSATQGEHISIIGESGCGKSTLLKLIYGLYDLDSGHIILNENPILGPKYNLIPGDKSIKYLAQDFDLMPFSTTAENVGHFVSNVDRKHKNKRVAELLDLVEMSEFASVKPKHLSGGQQQRVALAKVLALEPRVLLLDEPFSQVDTFRTNKLRRKLFQYLKEREITCIVATHDVADVLSFSDKTIVMKTGEIVAIDQPRNVYNNPDSSYVAALFGDVNEIPEHFLKPSGDKNKLILVYPHQLIVTAQSLLAVTVKRCYFKGSHYLVEAHYEFGLLYFEHSSLLPSGAFLYLN